MRQHQWPSWTQVDNIRFFPLIYQASHFIIEVYEVGQAWVSYGEAMLTTPDDFLVLIVPENDRFQDLLLHHLLRNQDEADYPVALWDLFPFNKDEYDIYFPPVFRHFFQSPWSRMSPSLHPSAQSRAHTAASVDCLFTKDLLDQILKFCLLFWLLFFFVGEVSVLWKTVCFLLYFLYIYNTTVIWYRWCATPITCTQISSKRSQESPWERLEEHMGSRIFGREAG